MQNPYLYDIGIKNGGECYSMFIFGEVIFRGMFDGLVIFLAVWMTVANAQLSNGHDYGMWAAGMSVFCASCFAANFWLFIRFNQHDKYSSTLFFLMLLSAHFFYWLFGFVFKNYEISHEFHIQWHRLIWLSYLFVMVYMWAYEMGKN
jgi:hypothetical protein